MAITQAFYRLENIIGLEIHARNGEIGKVDDILFDSQVWQTRYLVAELGNLFDSRRVLLAPEAIISIDDERVLLNLTKERIEHSPPYDADEPVSRRYERELFSFYQWNPYWRPAPVVGDLGGPVVLPPLSRKEQAAESTVDEDVDPNLRSYNEVAGYRIHTSDGDSGHCEDLIVHGDDWRVQFLVVKTGPWFFGKSVLVSPAWVNQIQWAETKIDISLSQETISDAPEVDIDALNEQHADALHRYYETDRSGQELATA